jgi:hypothetical protein
MSNPVEAMTASVPSWGAKLAFGESTTAAGHEVVPAALVVFGFGGAATCCHSALTCRVPTG